MLLDKCQLHFFIDVDNYHSQTESNMYKNKFDYGVTIWFLCRGKIWPYMIGFDIYKANNLNMILFLYIYEKTILILEELSFIKKVTP